MWIGEAVDSALWPLPIMIDDHFSDDYDEHDVYEKGSGVFSIIAEPEPVFVPGGSAMYILVPWKPVVLVWGLLSGMILVSFVASSVLQGKDPFAPGAIIKQPPSMKTGVAQTGQSKHSHKAAPTPSH